MKATLSTSSVDRLRERLETVSAPQAKANLKNVETAWRERIGGVVVRMRGLAGITQKELSALLEHDGQAQVARWESGKERPHFDLLFEVELLRQPLCQALAELAGAEIETTIRLRVRA